MVDSSTRTMTSKRRRGKSSKSEEKKRQVLVEVLVEGGGVCRHGAVLEFGRPKHRLDGD